LNGKIASLAIAHTLAQNHDDGDDQQKVNSSTHRVTAYQAQQPQNGQDCRNSSVHHISSSVFWVMNLIKHGIVRARLAVGYGVFTPLVRWLWGVRPISI
jgi:hypothetical protein